MNSSNNPTTPRWRLRLIGITIGILAAVLIAPTTGWLMRLEIYSVIHGNGHYHRIPTPLQRDFDVQLAEAVSAGNRTKNGLPYSDMNSVDERVKSLNDLAAKYPNEPAVYGTAVLYAMLGTVHGYRGGDERPLAYTANDLKGYTDSPRPSTAALQVFDADCANGERSDPNNAYFPAFRAYGLFAQNRDKEAIAELISAGNKPYYTEYYDDELDGKLKIDEAAKGGKEALSRITIGATMLFPHLARLRDLTRLSTAIAIVHEERGDTETGFEIRRANRRLGGLMRVDGQTLITSLVGIAISHIVAAKPDGIIPPGYAGLTDDGKSQAKDDTYVAYLNRIGHPEEAKAYLAECEAGREVKAITTGAINSHEPMTLAFRIALLLAVSYFILWNAFAIGICALLALALTRVPAIRSGSGITSAPVRIGIALGTGVLGVVLALSVGNFTANNAELVMLTLVPSAAIAVCTALLMRRLARVTTNPNSELEMTNSGPPVARMETGSWRKVLMTAVLTVAAWAILFAFAGWIANNMSAAQSSVVSIFQQLASGGNVQRAFSDPMASLPVLTIPIVIAIAGLFVRRGHPASVAIVRALAGSAAPIACILLIAYAGLVCYTARVEPTAVSTVDRMWNGSGEAQYYAAIEHKPWPGMVE